MRGKKRRVAEKQFLMTREIKDQKRKITDS